VMTLMMKHGFGSFLSDLVASESGFWKRRDIGVLESLDELGIMVWTWDGVSSDTSMFGNNRVDGRYICKVLVACNEG